MFTRLDYSSALEYSIIRHYTNIVYYYYISSLAYLPEMYDRACDQCVYGYDTIIYVSILSSQFYKYIDHTSTIIILWLTISSTHFMICVSLRYIICYNKKIHREMYIYTTTHFIYKLWYMYVFKCEWRENQNTLNKISSI